MIIVSNSVAPLKRFLAATGLQELAQAMLLRVVLAFILHRGRMSCSQAAGAVASESIHRGELTRFLARPRWQKIDFNSPLRQALLRRECQRGDKRIPFAGVKNHATFSFGILRRITI